MSNTTDASKTKSPNTLRELVGDIVVWLQKNTAEATKSALVGMAFGYGANIFMMSFVYDGFRKTQGGFATGQNSLIDGALVWTIVSTVVFTLYGYRKSVGKERFNKIIAEFPGALGRLVGKDGDNARSHLLWGAGVTLVGSQVISPALGVTVAVAMTMSATSLVGRIIIGVLFRGWQSLMATFAPGKKNPIDTTMSMTVCILGSCAAFCLAFFLKDWLSKFVLAGVCLFIAAKSGNKPQGPTAHTLKCLAWLLASWGLHDLLSPLLALADDGGYWENRGMSGWITSGGLINVAGWAVPGAVASGTGAAIGTGLGNVLGTYPPDSEDESDGVRDGGGDEGEQPSTADGESEDQGEGESEGDGESDDGNLPPADDGESEDQGEGESEGDGESGDDGNLPPADDGESEDQGDGESEGDGESDDDGNLPPADDGESEDQGDGESEGDGESDDGNLPPADDGESEDQGEGESEGDGESDDGNLPPADDGESEDQGEGEGESEGDGESDDGNLPPADDGESEDQGDGESEGEGDGESSDDGNLPPADDGESEDQGDGESEGEGDGESDDGNLPPVDDGESEDQGEGESESEGESDDEGKTEEETEATEDGDNVTTAEGHEPDKTDTGADLGQDYQQAVKDKQDAESEIERIKRQWEESERSADKSDPTYEKLKQQYDDYLTYLTNRANDADTKANEIASASQNQTTTSPTDNEGAKDRFKDDIDYNKRESDAWRQKLTETTDPSAREEIVRNIMYHDHMAQNAQDHMSALEGDGIVHHTPTQLDAFNEQLSAEQRQQMQDDFNRKMEEIKNQPIINAARRDQYDKLMQEAAQLDPEKRDKVEAVLRNAAKVDESGVPQGDLARMQRFLANQQRPDKGYGTFDGIWDITKDTVSGTGAGVVNVVTFGYSGVIADNAGSGHLLDSLGHHTANLVTFGGYEGYQKDGVTGAVTAIGKTLLPIDEAQILSPGSGATWDQRAGAFGSGVLKIFGVGKAGGKLISSRNMTAAEINNVKYGYHFTTAENATSIAKTGFESRLAGTHGGVSGLVSKTARLYKDQFVDNEPAKAGYMFGTSKPGAGRFGDLNFKEPPVVIDLTKVDPSKLKYRPADGAIIFTGDRVPPSAITNPGSWSKVPVSSSPLTANPLENVPKAAPWLAVNGAARQTFNQIYKES